MRLHGVVQCGWGLGRRRYNSVVMMAESQVLDNWGRFQTLAVLDLETTGLPHQEFNKTKITELSVIAANRKQIIEAAALEEKLPRVLHKLNLCIYPNKMISLGSSMVTGLYNDTLEDCGPFDENVFLILDAFFKRLPQPVCIVAHNGLRFDFPILQSELHRLGKKLPDSTLCADSLTAFRQLLGQKAVSNGISLLKKEAQLCEHLSECDEFDGVLYNMAEKFETQYIDSPVGTHCNKKGTSIQEQLEKTPSQVIPQSHNPPGLNHHRRETAPRKMDSRVRKRLFDKSDDAKFETEDRVLRKFKLGDVFEFLLGKEPINKHHAESDTLCLLQCIVAKGSQFIEWTDNNAKLFNDVRKLS